MTFPGVHSGPAARSAPVGWFGVVAQSDSFLESLSTGATTRAPFFPVREAAIDWWRQQSLKKKKGYREVRKQTVTLSWGSEYNSTQMFWRSNCFSYGRTHPELWEWWSSPLFQPHSQPNTGTLPHLQPGNHTLPKNHISWHFEQHFPSNRQQSFRTNLCHTVDPTYLKAKHTLLKITSFPPDSWDIHIRDNIDPEKKIGRYSAEVETDGHQSGRQF